MTGKDKIQKVIQVMGSGKIGFRLREGCFQEFFHALLGMETDGVIIGIPSGTHLAAGCCEIRRGLLDPLSRERTHKALGRS